MKKIIACLCCLSLVLSMAVYSITANAAETVEKSGAETVTYGGISYKIYDDHAEVTGVDDTLYASYNPDYAKTKVFAFPTEIKYLETGEVKPVTAISGEYGNLTAKEIIIPKSITSWLLYSRFKDNEALEEVTFEEGSQITNIPSKAFDGCTNLKRIGIEDTNRLPNSITEIDVWAFRNCSSLKSIELSDSITDIHDDTFSGCTSLESVKLSSNLVNLGSYYGSRVFKGCTSLKEISLPPTLEIVGSSVFEDCTSLKKVTFETYTSGENRGKSSLKEIQPNAFYNCSSLAEVNLPVSMNSCNIQKYAFANTGLKSINIPESFTQIEYMAFSGVKFENNLETPNGEKYAIGIFGTQTAIAQTKDDGRDDFNTSIFGHTYDEIPKDERPTIAGLSYSTANDFAIKEDFNFVSVGDWNPFKVIYPGDVDGDGKTSSKDSMFIQRYTVNLVKLTDDQIAAADVNKDGKVTSKDALLILRYSIGYKVEGL